MKFTILLEIFFELLTKRKLTATYLAEKYETSVRTIYRYVDDLSLCLPITVMQGRNGGICISDSFKLPKGFMTKEEYEAAIEALDAMYSQYPEEKFIKAKQKLSAQVKSETRDLTVTGDVGAILVDSGTWGDTSKFSEKIRLYETAIKDRNVLDIDYHSRVGEKSRRKIEPHVLVFKQGVWYVFAFCHKQKAFRLFRLGRIFSTIVTDGIFERRNFKRDDIPLQFWVSEAASVAVRLEITETGFADAQDWLGGENLRSDGKRWFADMTLPDDEALVRKIISMGAGVKILSPQSLQSRVKDAAKAIFENY
ncbi:MAG: YafY family transcriptional regulator [Clostridia bacterium]|nr:YafY family transcriptional regulator [Clostridia bacterium]